MKKLFAFVVLCGAVSFVGCAKPADTKKAETPATPAAGTEEKKDDAAPAPAGEGEAAAPAAEGEAAPAPATEGDAAVPAEEAKTE